MYYSIVLLVNPEQSVLVETSARTVLGSNYAENVPHITLAIYDQLPVIHRDSLATAGHASDGLILQGNGLAILPSRHENKIWIEVPMSKTAALLDLQAGLLKLVPDQTAINAVGDMFRPHITLGSITAEQTGMLTLITDVECLRATYDRFKLAIVKNDEEFRIKEIIT